MEAMHLACALAHSTGAQVALLRLIQVQHPSYLGTSFVNLPADKREYQRPKEYAATAEDYCAELTIYWMQLHWWRLPIIWMQPSSSPVSHRPSFPSGTDFSQFRLCYQTSSQFTIFKLMMVKLIQCETDVIIMAHLVDKQHIFIGRSDPQLKQNLDIDLIA
jgi:hypothetical protein